MRAPDCLLDLLYSQSRPKQCETSDQTPIVSGAKPQRTSTSAWKPKPNAIKMMTPKNDRTAQQDAIPARA